MRKISMNKRYSIADARHDLAAIVHELEHQPAIEITRRGEPVAVLLSMAEYRRLQTRQGDFWDAYTTFQTEFTPDGDDLAELLHTARDRTPGREVDL
jgi:prevent-host-death family protein